MWGFVLRNRMAAAAFCVAAAYCPGIFAGGSSPRWWVIAVGVPLASDVDPRKMSPPIALLLLAGLLAAAASAWTSPDPRAAGLELFFLSLLALTMVAAAGLEDLDPVIAAFGWGVAVSSPIVIMQAMGWSPVYQLGAPAGTFMNSEVLAETAAPVLAWAAWKHRWALASATSVPLLLCHSRIGIVAVVVGLVAGWRPVVRWLRPAALGCALLAGVVALGAFGIDKAASGLTRVVLWLTAVALVEPAGRGLGWWAAAHPGSLEEFAHSDALQFMVELGVGVMFFVAIVAMLIARRFFASRGEIAAGAAILFETAVSFPLHFPATGFLAAVLAGFLARRRLDVCLVEPLRRAGPGPALRWGRAPVDAVGGFGEGGPGDFPLRSAFAGDGARHLEPGRAGELKGTAA